MLSALLNKTFLSLSLSLTTGSKTVQRCPEGIGSADGGPGCDAGQEHRAGEQSDCRDSLQAGPVLRPRGGEAPD